MDLIIVGQATVPDGRSGIQEAIPNAPSAAPERPGWPASLQRRYAQPLLAEMSRDFDDTVMRIGFVAMLSQTGTATGVPVRPPRRQSRMSLADHYTSCRPHRSLSARWRARMAYCGLNWHAFAVGATAFHRSRSRAPRCTVGARGPARQSGRNGRVAMGVMDRRGGNADPGTAKARRARIDTQVWIDYT
jgi:hypothetical protein